MTYKRDLAEVIALISMALYAFTIIGALIMGGIAVVIVGYFGNFTYWYVGIPMVIIGILLSATIGNVSNRLFHWYYRVDHD